MMISVITLDHIDVLLRVRGVKFDGSTIGLAYVYSICTYNESCAFTHVSICNITIQY